MNFSPEAGREGAQQKRRISIIQFPIAHHNELRERFQSLGIEPTEQSIAIFPQEMVRSLRTCGSHVVLDTRNLLEENEARGFILTNIQMPLIKVPIPGEGRSSTVLKLALIFEQRGAEVAPLLRTPPVREAVQRLLTIPVSGYKTYAVDRNNLGIDSITFQQFSERGIPNRILVNENDEWMDIPPDMIEPDGQPLGARAI